MIYDEAIKSGVLVDLFTKEAFEELFIPEPRKNNIREYGEGQEVEIEVFDKKKDLIAKIPSELVQDFLDVQHFGKSWRSSLFGAK